MAGQGAAPADGRVDGPVPLISQEVEHAAARMLPSVIVADQGIVVIATFNILDVANPGEARGFPLSFPTIRSKARNLTETA